MSQTDQTTPVSPAWGQAYRCKIEGVSGIGYRGPFTDEMTVFYGTGQSGDHRHVPIGHRGLVIGEPVYVADEAKPGWVREAIEDGK